MEEGRTFQEKISRRGLIKTIGAGGLGLSSKAETARNVLLREIAAITTYNDSDIV